MRKIFLLLLLVSVLGACQKKQYATFKYQNSAAYIGQKSVTAAQKEQESLVVASNEPELLSASADASASFMNPAEIVSARIPTEAVTSSAAPAQAKTTSSTIAKPVKMTLAQKIIAKKIQKQILKANTFEGKKAVKEKADTIALLALIFGGAGLLLSFAGTGLGLLLGIAGLVLGIVGMSRIKKGQAPASSKTLALLGLIFGGVVTLLGLILVAALSSSRFYY